MVLTLQAIVCVSVCVLLLVCPQLGRTSYLYRPRCDASVSTLTTPGPRALAPGGAHRPIFVTVHGTTKVPNRCTRR